MSKSPKNPPNFTIAPIELLSDPNLTPYDRTIWLYIKYRQGKNAHAWPSEEAISRGTGGISIRTIRRSIKRLENEWLTVERPVAQGRGKFNKYSIRRGTESPPLTDKGGQDGRQKGDSLADELDTRNYIHSFDAFWKSYPRKVSKITTRKVWLKLKPSEQLFEKILAAIEQQKKTNQWQRENGRFIPYPTTWLNQERWDDEIDTPTTIPLKRDASGRTPRERMLAEMESKRT